MDPQRADEPPAPALIQNRSVFASRHLLWLHARQCLSARLGAVSGRQIAMTGGCNCLRFVQVANLRSSTRSGMEFYTVKSDPPAGDMSGVKADEIDDGVDVAARKP